MTQAAEGRAAQAAVPQSPPTPSTCAARTDGERASKSTTSMTDSRRGDLTQIRLPGLQLSEQRIRRSIRTLRDMLPALDRFMRAEVEKVIDDLHIAIDAIQ